MTDRPDAVLKLQDVSRTFHIGGQRIRAVDGVSLALAPGEVLGIVGESGCGKSTLARLVLRLLAADAGRIALNDVDVTHLSERALRPHRHRLQAVFQDPMSSLDPRWRVRDIIAEPLRALRLSRAEVAARVDAVLARVGLPITAAERHPHAFSGGQRQRIAIARALAAEPSIIVFDEATSALDVSVQAHILNLIADLKRDLGLAALFISHNLGAVSHISDRVAVMYLGRFVEVAPVGDLFAKPAHPYTRALIGAVLEPDVDYVPPPPLGGEIADPARPPGGCAFHPRCPMARPLCADVAPQSRRVGRRVVACHFPD